MTRISAIITTYNVEDYVATAMQSVIDAGFEDLELIVVDDGSTDATRRIADMVGGIAHGVDYQPVFFSQKTIGGVASAANAGLDHATGDVVVFVDGDDWVLPANLRAAVDLQLTAGFDFTVCGCKEYWNDSGNYTFYPEAAVWDELPGLTDLEDRRDAVLRMAPFPWRKIYSRAFLERHAIRFPVGDFFYEDNPFHWRTTLSAESFGFFTSTTHVHRMGRAGQSVTAMGLKPLKIFEHAETIRSQLASSRPSDILRERYFQWLVDHVLWCCRHVPPHGVNQIFDRTRPFLDDFPEDEFWRRLSGPERSITDIRRISAVYLGDRLSFLGEF